MGQTMPMRIGVTMVTGNGDIRRSRIDTATRYDAARWEELVRRANLDLPPPYKPEPQQAVYEISADDQVIQVADGDLVGPLRDLVEAVMNEGGTDEWRDSPA